MSDRSASGTASPRAPEKDCLRLDLREEKSFSSGKFNGTKPVSCEVIGNPLDVGKKWGDLYANLIEFLLDHGFLTDDYSYFQDTEPNQRSYRASNGLWAVINLSCDDSVKRIRSLVEESGISFNDIRITYRKGWGDPDQTVGDVSPQGRISQVRLSQVPSKRFSGTKPISLQIAGVTLAGASWRAVFVRFIEFLVRNRLIRSNHKYLQPKKGSTTSFFGSTAVFSMSVFTEAPMRS
ncbi:MAG: hypothetical protein IJG02_06620 [Thermoguttaceae bacterium]|nr:hypothetical protein [Thermoguttaceae bacterium]